MAEKYKVKEDIFYLLEKGLASLDRNVASKEHEDIREVLLRTDVVFLIRHFEELKELVQSQANQAYSKGWKDGFQKSMDTEKKIRDGEGFNEF